MNGSGIEGKLVSPAQVAAFLSISPKRVRRLLRSGDLPGLVRLGRQYRVDLSRLREWIAAGGTTAVRTGRAPSP